MIDGNTKRIDVYIPETRVIIEQKSLGKALDQKIRNSGEIDLNPFEQADRYNSKLTFDERARWIVTSNFAEIWIYDMNQKQPEPTKIALEELQSKYPLLDFLVKKEVKTISHEMEVSIKAGDIVGLIYDAFLKQYRIPDIKEKVETAEQRAKREHKLKSLNTLCVRSVFCLYAEDAGIFGKRNMFHDYLEAYEVKDCRRALIELFKILDTPVAERLSYIMGNPPFHGFTFMTPEQKEDMQNIFPGVKNLDFVCGWYKKASDYINGTKIEVAFVSTNSIVQGETVARFWNFMENDIINFAYKTFVWDSEANMKAHVHCVIIGFAKFSRPVKYLYDNGQVAIASNINSYLIDGDNILVQSRNKPLCNIPKMIYGNKPADGGHLIIEDEELSDFLASDPKAEKYIHPLLGAAEYINGKKRWCLWLVGAKPEEVK